MSPIVITKIQAVRKPQSDRSDKKKTHESLADIEDIIDNDSRKSTRSIARDMGMSEFLIELVVHEDNLYFSYKMRKRKFLSEDRATKLFNKLKHPPTEYAYLFLFVSLSQKNFCQDQMVNSQNNRWLALSPLIVIKTKYAWYLE